MQAPMVLWLVPLAYVIHMVEETPRFVPWTKRYAWMFTNRFTMPKFVIGNSLFMAYVLISVDAAVRRPSEWALIWGLSTAAWILTNFLQHAVLTLVSGEYSPGVVTAGAVYVPVALYVYETFSRAGMLTPHRILWSVIIGIAVMWVPQGNAMRMAAADRRREKTLAQ